MMYLVVIWMALTPSLPGRASILLSVVYRYVMMYLVVIWMALTPSLPGRDSIFIVLTIGLFYTALNTYWGDYNSEDSSH